MSSDFRGPYTPEVAPSFRGGPSDELRRSANLRRQGPAGAPGANDDPPTQPQADPFSPDPIRCHEVLVSSARRARPRRDMAGTSPGRRPGQPSRHNSPRPENAQFGVARPALAIGVPGLHLFRARWIWRTEFPGRCAGRVEERRLRRVLGSARCADTARAFPSLSPKIQKSRQNPRFVRFPCAGNLRTPHRALAVVSNSKCALVSSARPAGLPSDQSRITFPDVRRHGYQASTSR